MVTVKVGNWSVGFGSRSLGARRRPLALIILDGWGYSQRMEGNAIALANTPNYDKLCANYPKTLLQAAGQRVGLMPEAPGNSEIGHLNLGAGRVVQTDRARVISSIKSGAFFENRVLKDAFAKAREKKSSVHLVGLLSDGNVHASMDSLFALLRMARDEGCCEKTFVHGFLDGRDVPDNTAEVYVEAFQIKSAEIGCGKLATLCGRKYSMDRANKWERTARAYTMLVHSEGERAFDPISAIRGSYLRGRNDESIQPIVIEEKPGIPVASIKQDDVVIFFNHQADRMRQLVKSLVIKESGQDAAKPDVTAVCMVEYDRTFGLPVAFRSKQETNVLGKVFADHGVLNCRLAETEKYSHVTYFFNGGIDTEHPGEKRVLVPSPNGGRNPLQPENACFKVTDHLLHGLEAGENDVFIVNLAAADLLAHTGSLENTIEAVQFVDECLGEIIGKIHEVDGVALITSDHGNCEEMSDTGSGGPNISHTSNPVPFHFVANKMNGMSLRDDGALEDVAPTILGILGIEKPNEMTGRDLRVVGT